jgi:hypothetical protein
VQRHGRDEVVPLVARQRPHQQSGERSGERMYTAVLVNMDDLPQRAFVCAERVRGVEAAQPGAAEGAAALLIERKSILKGCPAAGAEVLGLERLDAAETRGTDWNAGDLVEGPAANPAIGRKEEGKKGAGGCANYRRTEICDCGSSTTREDPPPPKYLL